MGVENQLMLIFVSGLLGLLAIIFVLPRYVFYRKKYALRRGDPKRLGIKWRADREKIFVMLDSKEIGVLELSTEEEKAQGKSITLPDGSVLNVKLELDTDAKRIVFAPNLTIDGSPVPGSINDPGSQLDVAVKYFYWGGVINILVGISWLPDLAWYFILIVIPIGITAFLVGYYLKRLSRAALSVGIGLAILTGISFLTEFLLTLSTDTGVGIGGNLLDLVDTYFIIGGLFKGFQAIDYLENERKGITNGLPININHPLNLHQDFAVSRSEAVNGAEKLLEVNGKRFSIKIPAGIKDGTKLRVKGKGSTRDVNGESFSGDLYLKILIKNDEIESGNRQES